MIQETMLLSRLKNKVFGSVIVLIFGVVSCMAQMPKPNPEAYDTPPVLTNQEAVASVHQEVVRPGTETSQKSEPGVVLVQVTVTLNGLASHVMVIRGADVNHDEKVVEAIHRDRFKPAQKDGKPVLATIYLKVRFDSAAN